MENKKSPIIPILIIIIILFIGGWFALGRNRTAEKPKNNVTAQLNETGIVKLSSTPEGDYVPKEIRVKVGTKVRIEGDPQTLVGGMDTVIIDGYNVRKVISSTDNIIEFVADKTGTFKMYCANRSGNGTLIVE